MKKILNKEKEQLKSIAIFILIGISGGLLILNAIHIGHNAVAKKEVTTVTYQPASEAIVESGFYPGRIYGDYTDLTFCFDEYLNSIGASEVKRYMYSTGEGKIYELRFKYSGFDYIIKTTEFKVDLYSYGLYSRLEVNNGQVAFVVPTENSGTYINDATSPFKVDWKIFDVFHAATDKNSGLVKELRAGLEETNCPFYGLGIAHYEQWNDGTVIWHDDLGNITFDDGLDLHF